MCTLCAPAGTLALLPWVLCRVLALPSSWVARASVQALGMRTKSESAQHGTKHKAGEST